MAYTFGADNTDDIVMPVVSAVIGPTVSGLLTCWVNPNTGPTAGRAILGFGNNVGRIAHSSTPNEIDVILPTGGTDGTWTSSGLSLQTNTWRFLAIAWSAVAGPTMDVKLWAGDGVNPPVAVSIAQAVAPTGTFTSSSTATIGNGAASSAIAFQGDLAQFDLFTTSTAAGANHPFGQSAYGAFSAESEALLLSRFVLPLWQGSYRARSNGQIVNNTTSAQHISVDLGLQGVACRHVQTTAGTESIAALTINGATPSAQGCPRPRFGHAFASMPSRVIARR